MVPLIYLSLFCGVNAYLDKTVPDSKQTFDQDLYESVLDQELCHEQMQYLINNNTNLLLRFLDAGIRTPRGLLDGNLADLGNYFQCLAIDQEAPSTSSTIRGKYCMIGLPLNQNIQFLTLPYLPTITWPEFSSPVLNLGAPGWSEDDAERLAQFGRVERNARVVLGGVPTNRFAIANDSALAGLTLTLAMCIPKTCTTKQALSELLNDTKLDYEDRFCRLPNDKQWVAVDYLAIVLFSLLGLLCIASTGYDVFQTVIIGNDVKRVSKIYTSFSVYTNTRRLVTYTSVPGAIECMDGIRSFAMMWVIVGHTYVNQLSTAMANPIDVVGWMTSTWSIWITMAPITVDTFFLLSGLLLVYTTAGKMTGSKLLKNLHFFYLNRLLRMFPLLAAFVLIQASILNRVSDGPIWTVVADQTHKCRMFWWSTLLHVQNWVNPLDTCLPHTWYLAIDVQLYIISPLVLFWVLGSKKNVAWIALSAGLSLSLVGSTVYNFIMEFQAGPVIPSRDGDGTMFYFKNYYVNTLARSSPFFIGMIWGYILHEYRHKKIRLPLIHVATMWAGTVIIIAMVTYVTYPYMQLDWDNQTVDSIINSFMRPAWALAIGWMIFACHHGMGGPLNWVLSLQCFKLLSRLSYGMYLVHYPLIYLVNASSISPAYFSDAFSLFKFFSVFALTAIVSFGLTLLVDSPCSTLVKYFMGGGRRPRPPPVKNVPIDTAPTNGNSNQGYLYDESKESSL